MKLSSVWIIMFISLFVIQTVYLFYLRNHEEFLYSKSSEIELAQISISGLTKSNAALVNKIKQLLSVIKGTNLKEILGI